MLIIQDRLFNMAKQVFESPDILRMIYSFGDPDHRTFTRNLQSEIQSKGREFDDMLQKDTRYLPIDYILIHEYSTPTIESYLRSFNRCFCCGRHNHRKPSWKNNKVVMTYDSVFENEETGDCHCPCRSLSRIFINHIYCRYHNLPVDF